MIGPIVGKNVCYLFEEGFEVLAKENYIMDKVVIVDIEDYSVVIHDRVVLAIRNIRVDKLEKTIILLGTVRNL